MTQEPQRDTRATRRGVLAGVGLVGLAGAVSACSSGGSSSSATGASAGTATNGATQAATTPTSGATGTSGGTATNALATTSEIPVGGGMIFTAEKVVVTQPSAGEFKGFSAVCTHMGCIVNQISDGTIDCPCHGSMYSIKNGAVVGGPAPRPLPAVAIKVTGDSIVLG